MNQYDAIILTVPRDFKRMEKLYYKLEENLPVRKIFFIGSSVVYSMMKELNLSDKFDFVDENDIVPFDDVKAIIEDVFGGREVTRGFVGWYYQQFLKMQYARMCKDDFYLSWDGDTIPVQKIVMENEEGKPYIDWKRECNPMYFKTMGKLFPGMTKVMEPSFIAEHMLFSKDMMTKMLDEIENADYLSGETFYERILRAIGPEDLNGNAFSEFETYGTYLALHNPYMYAMRRWTSFRCCGQYFRADDITEKEMEWLGKDFHAISFEKGQFPMSGTEFFRNKEYQEKLTARYILEVVQEEMTNDGYKETWD